MKYLKHIVSKLKNFHLSPRRIQELENLEFSGKTKGSSHIKFVADYQHNTEEHRKSDPCNFKLTKYGTGRPRESSRHRGYCSDFCACSCFNCVLFTVPPSKTRAEKKSERAATGEGAAGTVTKCVDGSNLRRRKLMKTMDSVKQNQAYILGGRITNLLVRRRGMSSTGSFTRVLFPVADPEQFSVERIMCIGRFVILLLTMYSW